VGISRSPAFVIAYLMESNNISYEEAFKLVKSKRFCIKPNMGFELQLKVNIYYKKPNDIQ